MSAYIISNLDVSDEAELSEYLRLAPASIARHGGRYLVRRGRVEPLEGEWRPALVVLEFPTAADARGWYESPDYQEIRSRHFKGAKRELILVEGI